MDNPALNDATNTALDIIKNDDVVGAHIRMGVSAGLAWYSTYTLQDWVAIVTIAYIIFQIGLLIPKYYAMIKTAFEKKTDGTAQK